MSPLDSGVTHPLRNRKMRCLQGVKFISLIELLCIRNCTAFHAYGRPRVLEAVTERKEKSRCHCSRVVMPLHWGPWELCDESDRDEEG